MTFNRAFDVVLAGFSVLAWSLAGYLAGSRLLSNAAGIVLALAIPLVSFVLMAGKRDRTLDLMLSLLGVLAWGFAAFVLGARLISDTAGGVLGLAVGFSALASVVNGHLREARIETLMRGACPRCQAKVKSEHRHRRWEPSSGSWLSPDTSWRCEGCGYEHSEVWECPSCPSAE